jgi:hypothetical protein
MPGHSYKGSRGPTPAPAPAPLVLTWDVASQTFTLAGPSSSAAFYLLFSPDNTDDYFTYDVGFGPAPIAYYGDATPGYFFCDADDTLTAPGPNSSNVFNYPGLSLDGTTTYVDPFDGSKTFHLYFSATRAAPYTLIESQTGTAPLFFTSTVTAGNYFADPSAGLTDIADTSTTLLVI